MRPTKANFKSRIKAGSKSALPWLLRPFSKWRIVAAAFACIGILHIGTTFALPHMVGTSAYSRLKPLLPENQMLYLPKLGPDNQPLPFMGADVLYALCRFETRKSPVMVTGHLPGAGWSLSLHAPNGDNIYVATGQDDRPITINLKLVPSGARFAGLTPEALGIASRQVQHQVMETRKGIAMIRAPDRGLAYRRHAEINIEKSTCYRVDR